MTDNAFRERWDMLTAEVNEQTDAGCIYKLIENWYQVKTIKSGTMLEIEGAPMPSRKLKEAVRKIEVDTEKVKANNQKQAEKKLTRLLEANFDENDFFVTVTFAGEKLPVIEEVNAKIDNYLRRVRYYSEKIGDELMYIRVTEGDEEGSRKKRLHAHMIIKSGLGRMRLKELWKDGCIRIDELDPRGYNGLTRLASYISKDPKGKKRWSSSKNLKKPTVSIAEKKLNKKKAQKMARPENRAEAIAALEKLYPRYRVEQYDAKENKYIGGCNIYARMRLKEEYWNEQGHAGGKHGGGRGDQADAKRREVRSVPPRGEKTVRQSGRRA